MQKNNPKKWDTLYLNGAKYRPLNELLLNRIIKKTETLTKQKIKTFLDLGCGTGDTLVQFEKRGCKSIGVDFSAVALAKAKEKNLPNAKLIRRNLNSLLNFSKEKNINFILCKLTIAFVANQAKFLKNVKKIMTDKTVFCIITPVLHTGVEYTKEDKPGIAVNYNEFKNLIKQYFKKIVEFNHEYIGERVHIVTFLMMK